MLDILKTPQSPRRVQASGVACNHICGTLNAINFCSLISPILIHQRIFLNHRRKIFLLAPPSKCTGNPGKELSIRDSAPTYNFAVDIGDPFKRSNAFQGRRLFCRSHPLCYSQPRVPSHANTPIAPREFGDVLNSIVSIFSFMRSKPPSISIS
jgi:hypothetical protein